MIEKLEFKSKEFPPLLREIPHQPKSIYVRGRLFNNLPHIAIVGTRKASQQGIRIAKEFARDLGRQGFVIVSGLAMGIDSAAHEGALLSDNSTIAVLANGLDRIYPRQNYNLAKRLIKSGAIVSEYDEGTPSFPNQFIERNRIISGLSLGVIVIEAPKRSGSLATARFALEQNRDVFVVPGPIKDENYEGSHKLIKQGAALVTSVDDIIESLNIGIGLNLNQKELFASGVDKKKEDGVAYSGIDEIGNRILKVLKSIGQPATIDEICLAGNLNSVVVSRSISVLVIKDLVKDSGGKYYL